jgi:hypothetical protein
MLVVGDRQRAHGAAGKRVLQRDEAAALGLPPGVPVAARELQARLVGLGAAVAEEHARQAREVGQAGGGIRLERMVVEVRGVQQRRCLLGDHGGEARMGVAERRDADAGHEVEVGAAVGVVQARPLTAHEDDRLAPVGLQHVAGFLRLNVVERYRHGTTCVQPVSAVVRLASASNRT